jgi:FMN phosphatase YigB (HAD superfamily)
MNNRSFSPHTHIFFWDLHEVILRKDRKNWFTICLSFNKKWELIKNVNKKSLVILVTFILERLKIIKKQMVSEELIQAARDTNNEAFVELIVKICSAYSPIQETVSLMHQLSALGYKHHLGSNIGETVYNHCLTTFPEIFNLFEHKSIAHTDREKKIVKKPHPDFFTTHITKYNLKPEHCIFIDDRLINVRAAQSIGMHGIHFINAQQLRKELKKYTTLS